MLDKYGKRTRNFWGVYILFYFSFPYFFFFNKEIIPLAFLEYEMILAYSTPRASLAIYQFISNARLLNN